MKEVEQPIISKNQILVKVFAANVSSGDMRLNTLDVPLLLIPIVKLIFGFKDFPQKDGRTSWYKQDLYLRFKYVKKSFLK